MAQLKDLSFLNKIWPPNFSGLDGKHNLIFSNADDLVKA